MVAEKRQRACSAETTQAEACGSRSRCARAVGGGLENLHQRAPTIRVTHFLAALAIGTLAAPVAVTAAQMAAQLQPDRIYLGTQTLLVVEVVDAGETEWPSVAPVAGLDIQRYHRPSLMRDLFSGRSTLRFQFLVTPSRTGRFEIPAVSLKIGGAVLKEGPFTLQVVEAALKFRAANLDPTHILVGETATLEVQYQGVRPGVSPVVPEVEGLTIRPVQLGRVEVSERDGMPVTTHSFEIKAERLGVFTISGITFEQVPAAAVRITVAPFVVIGAEISEPSLVVGSRTIAHVLIRGLPQSADVTFVAPAGVKVARSQQSFRSRTAGSLFSFDVTPTEPGNFTLDTLELKDGRKISLPQPLSLSVRQSGDGEIFACRGIPSSDETIVGEPFRVDYEVFFRGDIQGAAVDLSQAGFAGKEYVKIEPVSDLSYTDWQGQSIEAQFGNRRINMLLGSGAFNGQKEQLLRFALTITPLATGELSLDGLRVVLLLQLREERRTAMSFFSSSQTRQFARVAEVPSHLVVDPPGITRPALYRDAVGRSFAFIAELDRTSATAMSPLTLTMKITGESVGTQFAPPPLTQIPELTRDFDVSATVNGGEVSGNTITFTQVVRPRSEEVSEFPALPLVYFDYEKKEYKTAFSLPIPLEIRPGSLVGAAAMETVASAPQPGGGETGRRSDEPVTLGLGANYTSLGDIVTAPLSFQGIVGLLAAGPFAIMLIWTGRWTYRKRRPLAAGRQQRRRLLNSLGRFDDSENFHVHLADVLQSYLRLRFDLPPGELSLTALVGAFDRCGFDHGLRDEALSLLRACDVGRFASNVAGDGEKTGLTRRARELCKALDRSCR